MCHLVIFGTDFILYYEHIIDVSSMVCGIQIKVFALVAARTFRNTTDPLSALCVYHVPLVDRYKFLQNDTSKHARFYRWAKKMKKQWNIQQKTLIISTVASVSASIIVIILFVYVLSPCLP